MQSCSGNEVCASGDRCCSTACTAEAATIRGRPSGAADTKLSLASSASPSTPVAAPKSDAPPPKAVVSDRRQTLIVAQQTFRFLTHLQRIEETTDETVEWWELRDAKEHVIYRESYLVAFENGMFESTVGISADSFTT